jgi:hypothetical protein
VILPLSIVALLVGIYWERRRSGGDDAVKEVEEELAQQVIETN